MNVQKQMEGLYTKAAKLLSQGDFEGADQLLREFIPSDFEPIVGVGLIRITFSHRDKLRAWEPLLDRVRTWLGEEKASRLLRGLESD
jgi:hypothetical protein